MLKRKNSNSSWTNFQNSFLMSQECSTMSPQQKAAASDNLSHRKAQRIIYSGGAWSLRLGRGAG